MRSIGFLHTAQAHVATFDALVCAADPSLTATHTVKPELLADARAHGPNAELESATLAALADLRGAGAATIVCTCSTLGAVAEGVSEGMDVPVLRVDRPMARRAVEAGPRIGVVLALASTLAPTRDLILDAANAAGRTVQVVDVLAAFAWTAFESGDHATYLDEVAAAARGIAAEVDVLVLAQASMADAAALLTDLDVPVLSSPALAVSAAIGTL